MGRVFLTALRLGGHTEKNMQLGAELLKDRQVVGFRTAARPSCASVLILAEKGRATKECFKIRYGAKVMLQIFQVLRGLI